jgi:hypothetical protein
MAGDSIIDKMKAKVNKMRFHRHSATGGGGTAGVRMPAVAAHSTGTSVDSKPSMMEKIKNKISGGRNTPSGPSAVA